jgi:hypothetical protein
MTQHEFARSRRSATRVQLTRFLQAQSWYPLQSGDQVTVTLDEEDETYVAFDEPGSADGAMLRLTSAAYPGEEPSSPDWSVSLLSLWLEVGPGAISVTRRGRVLHAAAPQAVDA